MRLTEAKVNFYLPNELHEAITELAEAADRPLSRELRRAVTEYVERHRAEAANE